MFADKMLRATFRILTIGLSLLALLATASASDSVPAKKLFGAKKLPAVLNPAVHGFYSKGCLAGGIAIPTDGPTWQAMRLSRNRRWGHPDLIKLVERLSKEAAQHDGWPGLLVGDISQPRGGPMLTGHASHQVGLDADIWLTPMPNRRLSANERENVSAVSVLKSKTLHVDPNKWTDAHARLIMRAASYPQVQRIFVHPGIKKKLCDQWPGDRSSLGKVRPYYGHHYHFHIRIHCPPGSTNCRSQNAVPAGTGCDKSLDWWFTSEPWAPPKKKKPTKPAPKKREKVLSDLPPACAIVLDAAAPASELAVTLSTETAPTLPVSPRAKKATAFSLPTDVPIPTPRPN